MMGGRNDGTGGGDMMEYGVGWTHRILDGYDGTGHVVQHNMLSGYFQVAKNSLRKLGS